MPLILYKEYEDNYDYFKVHKDSYKQYYECLKKIRSLVDKGKIIPKNLFKQYESYIEDTVLIRWIYYEKKKAEIENKIFEFFIDKSHYKKFEHISNGYVAHLDKHYNFDALVHHIVIFLVNKHLFQLIEKDKDNFDGVREALQITINEIEKYFSFVPEKMRWSPRMKYVFCGVVADSFGFGITNQEKTVSNIYHAVYDILKYHPKTKKPANN